MMGSVFTIVLTWKDLALRLKGRFVSIGPKSEKSAEVVAALRHRGGKGPNGRKNASIMELVGKSPQMFRQLELPFERKGEAPRVRRSEEEPTAVRGNERSGASDLMAEVVGRPNLQVALKDRVRRVTRRTGGGSIEQVVNELRVYLTGWKQYHRLAETPRIVALLDEWLRHRLRAIQLKQWKASRRCPPLSSRQHVRRR